MYLDTVYKLELCVADEVLPDGPLHIYAGLKEFWEDKNDPNAGGNAPVSIKPILGYRIINSYTGTTPTACESWHNTVEEALEDYNKNILHISGGDTTSVAGLRKPTLFEEIKNFDLSQMASFLQELTERHTERIYPAIIQAKKASYQKGSVIDACGQILSVTDESADAAVPDIPPVIDGHKNFTVTLPEGYLAIDAIEKDPAGKTGILAQLYDRKKNLISSALLARDRRDGIMSMHVVEDEANTSEPVIISLYHLPEIIPGEFPPDIEDALRGVLFDINLSFEDYHLTENGHSWQITEFCDKTVAFSFQKKDGSDRQFLVSFTWTDTFNKLSIKAEYMPDENESTEKETVLAELAEISEEHTVWSIMMETFSRICSFAEDKGWAHPF